MARPVLTKRDFVRRYQAGEFGNRCPSWLTLDELLTSGHTDPVHIRNRVPGGDTWYNVPLPRVAEVWRGALTKYGPQNLYIGAMGPPDEARRLQGEVQTGLWGLDLYYTTVRRPMRDALQKQAFSTAGATSLWLLRRYLDEQSYEWLRYLLDEYKDHVVEFSSYSCEWGTLKGYNTVFWEVRKY